MQVSSTFGEYPAFFLRGRHFSPKELEIISSCVLENFHRGRTFISLAVCNKLDWKQPNGYLKDRACRQVLGELHALGIITLPPSKVQSSSTKRSKPPQTSELNAFDLVTPITTFPDAIYLEFAKGNKSEKVWNALVDQYHYLGHRVVVGRSIKYLVKTGDILLGALSFSSPAWRLSARDKVLESIGFSFSDIHELVINNSRFLILPNVRVDNLASSVLSLATQRISDDWLDYYAVKPEIAETFVQRSKYVGTCYRAANWLDIGLTKGYTKKGSLHQDNQELKTILLYGLNKRMRKVLRQSVSDAMATPEECNGIR